KSTPVAIHQQLTIVGRASPGGPVDDLILTAGHWAAGPGQIVLSSQSGLQAGGGAQVTVAGGPSSPELAVVGLATTATSSAQGWATPVEFAALHAAGAPKLSQMLYTFSSAATTAAVNTDIAAITAALPHGSVLGAQSWLTAKAQATASFAPWVP